MLVMDLLDIVLMGGGWTVAKIEVPGRNEDTSRGLALGRMPTMRMCVAGHRRRSVAAQAITPAAISSATPSVSLIGEASHSCDIQTLQLQPICLCFW